MSHVRLSDREIYSSLIPYGEADVIMGFEPAEVVRNIQYLKNGGKIFVHELPIKPVTDTLSKESYEASDMIAYLKEVTDQVIVMDCTEIFERVNSKQVLNVALLGATFATGSLDIKVSDMEKTIASYIKPQYVDMNLKALKMGAQLAWKGSI